MSCSTSTGGTRSKPASNNIGAVRDAVGTETSASAVDFHGRVHKPMAKVLLRELEPFHLMFVEEPVLSEHVDSCLDVPAERPRYPSPWANDCIRAGISRHVVSSGAVDIIQPDPRTAAASPRALQDRALRRRPTTWRVALHCPLGPIALASLPADRRAACYNAVIQEQSLGIHYNTTNDLLDYLVDRKRFRL